jgi:hypothetical protein
MTYAIAGLDYGTDSDLTIDQIIAEIAERENEPGTDEYDEALFELGGMAEWEVVSLYTSMNRDDCY